MNICKKLSLLTLSLFLFVNAPTAQVSITTLGPPGAYTQDFSALTSSDFPLTDNTAPFVGFYAFCTSCNAIPNIFAADNGSDSTPEFKNYGAIGNLDRALGSIASSGPVVITGDMFYGIRLQNNSGSVITSVEVRYTGEQWRDASAVAQTVDFSFRQDAGPINDLTSGTYTDVDSLDFTTPFNVGLGAPLDGNDPANREAIVSSFAVNIPVGGELMLRWADGDDPFLGGHGVAIDDVVVIARAGTTAADATISGRVVTASGRGISGARIVLTGGDLTEPLYTLTNAFGFFSFAGIESGRTYAVTVSSKRYRFSEPTRTVDLSDSATGVDFVSDP